MKTFLLFAAAAGTLSAQAPVPPLPELRFAEIQAKEKFLGDRWSYMEAGPSDAPAIVALHGLGDNAMQWRFQLAGLSDRFRVVAWNAPGYLLSDGFKAEKPGCQDYADALGDFLEALQLMRVHLLGNSFGSRVAQCFAMYHPERVIKLIFVGPSAGRKGMTPREKDDMIAARKAQIAPGGYRFPNGMVKALLGPKTTPERIELTAYAMRAVDPRGWMWGSWFGVAEGYSLEEVGAKVTKPLLLIAGDADRISPVATNAAPLAQAVRGARLEILKGIGHLPHMEAPEEVNRLALEFLLPGSARSTVNGN